MIGAEFLQAGSFNVRLSVESPAVTPDGMGGTFKDWQAIFDVWVRLVPVKGILLDRARNTRMDISHWIFLRNREDIERNMRFVANGGSTARIFEIETIHDPDETGRYLLCEVREIE